MAKEITKIISYLTSLSVTIFLITGCFGNIHRDYPTVWGDTIFVDDNNLHLFEGTYENPAGGANLAELLFGEKRLNYTNYQRKFHQDDLVSLEIVNEKDIHITAYRDGGIIKQKVLSDNQFSIKEGWITFESMAVGSHVVTLELQKWLYKIRVNHNGDLIIKERQSAFGFLLVLPMGGDDDHWYRFRNVRNNVTSLPPAQPKQQENSFVDIRFTDNNDGTVSDSKTGLMWATRNSDKGLTKDEAAKYCRNFKAGGFSDWRMPERSELVDLYKSGIRSISVEGNHAIQIIWKIHHSSADPKPYDFDYKDRYWGKYDKSDEEGRALPVRQAD